MGRSLLATSIVVLLCGSASLADPRGYWSGTVTTASGALPIGISIDGAGSAAAATLDAPELGYVDKPLVIKSTADGVHFELEADGTTIAADTTVSGDQMRGVVAVGAAKYPLELQRGIKPEKSYATEAVTIRNDDVSLAATLYLPRSDKPVPGIAFVAGLVPRSGFVHFLADLFARRGIAVLTYDRRGLGKSGGKPRASFEEHASDAAAAVTYLRARREIDSKRVGIRGQSQGAWLAPLAAMRVPVAFIIATGGGGVLPWQSETYAIPARMQVDGFSAGEIAEATRYMHDLFAVARTGEGWDALNAMMNDLRTRGSRWFGKYGPVYPTLEQLQKTWRSEFSYDPAPALQRIKVPYLALLGERDVYSPSGDSVKALNRLLTTSDKTVRVIRGATHDFRIVGGPLPLVSDEYIQTIIDWTTAHAGLASSALSVLDHTIMSTDPKLRVDVDPSLRFIGSFAFGIRNAARAERFVFADAGASGNVRRLFVAQFERMLPEHRGAYDAPPNPNLLRIGPLEFQQAAGRYTFAAAIAAKPGLEAERTRDFLAAKGLHVDGDLVVARFEAHTDSAHRSELILFYWEDLTTAGLTKGGIENATARAKFFDDFLQRARMKFKIRE